jgi:TolB-like protein/Flp pilus assembly protein TadD
MADITYPGSNDRSDGQSGSREFRLADWAVSPTTNRISLGTDTIKLEPKVMEVLVYLADHVGQTVTRDELGQAVWRGAVVSDDAITNAITKLRKAFGDDSRSSGMIETIPKRGYRLLATVRWLPDDGEVPAPEILPVDPVLGDRELHSLRPTIAVLPFRNLSGDSEQDYFSEGISEDITTALSNTGWYEVVARHAAFVYKGTTTDLRQIGKELGAQYILEGSVRRVSDKLRVTAELIEPALGKHIWGNRYQGTLADVFDFQDQITQAIVGTVEGIFQCAEGERVRQKRPESMEAYDYLLRGLAYMNKLTPEDAQTALKYFSRAIEKDPGYGRAYAYAFWYYRRRVQERGMILSSEEKAEAIRLMNAGLKADRDDPVVLWQAATLKLHFEHDFEGALALLDRSLSIDPNSPRAWNASSMAHACIGDSDTSRKHAEHVLRISPRNPTHWATYALIATACMQDGSYAEAADSAMKALQLNNYAIQAHLILAASCAQLKRLEEATAAVKQALKLNPNLTIARLTDFLPIERFKNLSGYMEGLQKAGLPT